MRYFMGMLPNERLQPSTDFYYRAVGLFGSLKIRDSVTKETHGKIYRVLFNCLTRRAVYVVLTEVNGASSFYYDFAKVCGCTRIS